jgi:hypothetical protein
MNYYIIPKSNCNINIKITLDENIYPYLSFSLIYHLNDIKNQLLNIEKLNEYITVDYVNKIVNPFEFIHTNIPGLEFSISKVKPESSIFFELLEIFHLCYINDILYIKQKINIFHITPNFTSTKYLLNMLREFSDDEIYTENFNYNELFEKFVKNNNCKKYDLFIFEFLEKDYINNYIKNILLVLYIVIKNQANYGTCIIKIDNIFYKAILDVLMILSCVFDKMYLIKPAMCNITNGDRYLVCKTFNSESCNNMKLLQQLEDTLVSNFYESIFCKKEIFSIIDNEIPYYFINKIEETNAVIGQIQLESLDQIINILQSKNRDDKIDNLKRNHIQKCIQWCEKYQIPHNKINDKINIFLENKKDLTIENTDEIEDTYIIENMNLDLELKNSEDT